MASCDGASKRDEEGQGEEEEERGDYPPGFVQLLLLAAPIEQPERVCSSLAWSPCFQYCQAPIPCISVSSNRIKLQDRACICERSRDIAGACVRDREAQGDLAADPSRTFSRWEDPSSSLPTFQPCQSSSPFLCVHPVTSWETASAYRHGNATGCACCERNSGTGAVGGAKRSDNLLFVASLDFAITAPRASRMFLHLQLPVSAFAHSDRLQKMNPICVRTSKN